jgi:hypothetical protein
MPHGDHNYNYKLTFACGTFPDRNFSLSEVLVPQYLQKRTAGKLNWETGEFWCEPATRSSRTQIGIKFNLLNSEAPGNDFILMLLPKGGASSLHKLVLVRPHTP